MSYLYKRSPKNGKSSEYVDFDIRFGQQCWLSKKEVDGVLYELRLPLITELDIERWLHECPALGQRTYYNPSKFPDLLAPHYIHETRKNESTGETEFKVSFWDIPGEYWLKDCLEKVVDPQKETELQNQQEQKCCPDPVMD